MTSQINRVELSKLRAKVKKALDAPFDKRGELMQKAREYSRLVLRRHRVSSKEYHINLSTGRIEKTEPLIGEDKVQAEIEQHL